MEYDLVFEGGGAKGFVFVGAMQEFERRGNTYRRLLGTSAGAITACLLAAGYDSNEMMEALAEQQDGKSVFTGFMAVPEGIDLADIRASVTRQILQEINLPLIPDVIEEKIDDQLAMWLTGQSSLRCVFSFIEMGGWFSADNFVAWLKKRLDTGAYQGKPRQFSDLTLRQFFEQTHRELTVVASDTTDEEMLVLNHVTAPDLPLVYAVRMSMSIPLLWQCVTWCEEWGQYRGQSLAGHEIVDGGVLSNFPIALFLSKDPFIKNLMGPDAADHVLGLLIDEAKEVPGAAQAAMASFSFSNLKPVQRINHLVSTATNAHDKMIIEEFEQDVARMPAKGYGTTEFNMTEPRRRFLVDAGCQAMKEFLDQAVQPANVPFTAAAVNSRAVKIEKADRMAAKILAR